MTDKAPELHLIGGLLPHNALIRDKQMKAIETAEALLGQLADLARIDQGRHREFVNAGIHANSALTALLEIDDL